MEVTGKITKIFEEKSFNGGFTKREFVVTTNEQYPQPILFEMHKEKATQIAQLKSGDVVKVLFDIRGREWQEKYFNSLVAWKIEPLAASSSSDEGAGLMPPPPTPIEDDGETDDLPF